ncbi:E3 ubiquitin-protein ligase rnf8 [Nymphon striatum]|nr:E3 ubiquitin-protein ligase rnf8 [Nymphon striatum]KAG1663345.1 E3 ubiquitin-protein ligase rnf8 [Nymphon striatum]
MVQTTESIDVMDIEPVSSYVSFVLLSVSTSEIIVGRDIDVNYRIDSVRISRRHALLRYTEEEKVWCIEDLNSLNGTCVAGNQLKSGVAHRLSDKDIIRFGPLDIEVDFEYVFNIPHSEDTHVVKKEECTATSIVEKLKVENEQLAGQLDEAHAQYKNKEKYMKKEVQETIEKLKDEMKDELKAEFEKELIIKEEKVRKIMLDQHTKIKHERDAVLKELETTNMGGKNKNNLVEKKNNYNKALSDMEVTRELFDSELSELLSQKEKNSQTALVAKSEVLEEFHALMVSEMECAICTELFINAVTLNCSHSFCKFCLNLWKDKGQTNCPICLQTITTENKSLVLDTFIDRVTEKLPAEKLEQRQKLKEERKLIIKNKKPHKRNRELPQDPSTSQNNLYSSRQLRQYCHCGIGKRHSKSNCPNRTKRQKRTRN